MRVRHSTVSFAMAATLAACATSGIDNLHGPAFEDEAGAPLDGGRDEGADSSHDAGAPADTGADAAAVDAPEEAGTTEAGNTADASAEGASEGGAGEAGTGCTSSMALLAAGGSSLAEASYAHGQWAAASTVAGGASAAPSLVPFGGGYLASFVGTGATGDLPLKWASYAGSWTAPAAIGAALGQGTPALAALGTTAHVVYWGSDGKFYHGTFSGSAWDAASDPVGGSGAAQSFGPSAPAAAPAGTTLLAVQSGSNGVLYDQAWTGSWQAASAHAGSSLVSTLSPAVVAMNGGGADVMVVFVHAGDAGSYYLQYSTRTAGTWSTPANVYAQGATIAYAGTTPALAASPNGGAILAWQGSSPASAYASTYSAAGWTAPVAVSTDTLLSPPSVAPGVCGADATMAYVKTGGAVEVVTASGGAWGTPQAIAGATGMQWVALAATP